MVSSTLPQIPLSIPGVSASTERRVVSPYRKPVCEVSRSASEKSCVISRPRLCTPHRAVFRIGDRIVEVAPVVIEVEAGADADQSLIGAIVGERSR